jgi:hypothetical protein
MQSLYRIFLASSPYLPPSLIAMNERSRNANGINHTNDIRSASIIEELGRSATTRRKQNKREVRHCCSNGHRLGQYKDCLVISCCTKESLGVQDLVEKTSCHAVKVSQNIDSRVGPSMLRFLLGPIAALHRCSVQG